MTPLDHVLNLLQGRGSKTKQLTPTQWEAQCPAHEDRTSSLSLSEGADRQALIYCHAGCTLEAIIGALGLKPADLYPPKKSYDDQILTVYDYHNPEGDIIFQVVKKAGKQFRQRRPDSKGGWIWDLDGVTRVPYQLPDLIAAVKDQRAIFIPEGEKDADKLRSFGLTATTNPGGAGKWRPEYNQWFQGANRIFILPDNDQPGQSHAQEIARNLTPHVNSLKIINLPNLPAKGDITDWFDNGGTLDQLRQLVKTINPYTPTEGATDLGQLIQEVYDWYGRFVSYPTQHDQLAHTLWTIHTHIMDSWNSTPRIAFLSPDRLPTSCSYPCRLLIMVELAYHLKVGDIPKRTIIMHLNDMVDVGHALHPHVVATANHGAALTISSYGLGPQLSPPCSVIAGIIHQLQPAVPTPQTAADPAHPHLR